MRKFTFDLLMIFKMILSMKMLNKLHFTKTRTSEAEEMVPQLREAVRLSQDQIMAWHCVDGLKTVTRCSFKLG